MGRLQKNNQELDIPMQGVPSSSANNAVENFGMMSSIMTPALMREMATIYAQMAIAQSRPRNYADIQRKLKNICARESLAAASTYAYAKGGTEISGPSIRLAEAIAAVYGNFKYGYEVTDKSHGNSKIRAYAFDMETNTQAERIWNVPHWRDTKSGGYEITDAREIYELEANQASRRIRSCILEILPRDIVEFALAECDNTARTKLDLTPERINQMVEAFRKEFGVSKAALEEFVQRTVESMHKSQFVRLRQIYRSLKDGMAKPEDFFSMNAGKDAPEADVRSPDEPPTQDPEETAAPTEPDDVAGPEAFDDAPFDDGDGEAF